MALIRLTASNNTADGAVHIEWEPGRRHVMQLRVNVPRYLEKAGTIHEN